jgi:hypothetical protein
MAHNKAWRKSALAEICILAEHSMVWCEATKSMTPELCPACDRLVRIVAG